MFRARFGNHSPVVSLKTFISFSRFSRALLASPSREPPRVHTSLTNLTTPVTAAVSQGRAAPAISQIVLYNFSNGVQHHLRLVGFIFGLPDGPRAGALVMTQHGSRATAIDRCLSLHGAFFHGSAPPQSLPRSRGSSSDSGLHAPAASNRESWELSRIAKHFRLEGLVTASARSNLGTVRCP